VARGPVKLLGAIIEIEEATGRALSIERFSQVYEAPEPVPQPPAAAPVAPK